LKRETQAGLAVLVISSLLAIGLAEIVLRVAGIGYGNAPFDPHPVLRHVHPPGYSFVAYDPGGEFGGHIVRYDADGRRIGTRPETPAAGQRLALVVGDSAVEAIPVSHEDSFVGRLDAASPVVHFANLGVSRYSTVLTELQLRSLPATVLPALVLHLMHRNDVREDREYLREAVLDSAGVPQAVPGPEAGVWFRILRGSYLVRLLRKVQVQAWWMISGGGAVAGGVVEDRDLLTPETSASMRRIAAWSRQRGSTYVLSCIPSQIRTNRIVTEYEDVFCPDLKSFADREGITYIDLYPRFDQAERKPFFDRDIHFNPYGHELAAAALLEGLIARGLLPAAN
jgi:hypothetical protein